MSECLLVLARRVLLGAVVTVALGCATAEEFEELDHDSTVGEELGEKTQAIYGTPPTNGRAAVRLTSLGCSGVLLNNQTVLTAAHCVSGSGTVSVNMEYRGPTIIRSWTRSVNFTRHPSYNGGADFDFAVGTMGVSLDLPDREFAPIYLGTFTEGREATLAGYGTTGGGGTDGLQRRMHFRVTWAGSNHIQWAATNETTGSCPGDSGGPGLRWAGYTDGTPYWESVASIHHGRMDGSLSGCGNTGRASRVANKVDWIKNIIATRTSFTCKDFTNPAGERASWCW